MDSNTQGVVDALTMSMEYYVGLISSAVVNFFKFTFCVVNEEGSIIRLNFLGSIVILFLGITLMGMAIKYLLEALTPWHHESEFIKDEDDLTTKTNEVLPPVEKKIEPKIKKEKPIKINIDPKRIEFEKQELERLKALRKIRKQNKK